MASVSPQEGIIFKYFSRIFSPVFGMEDGHMAWGWAGSHVLVPGGSQYRRLSQPPPQTGFHLLRLLALRWLRSSELCFIIFITKNPNENCHLSMRRIGCKCKATSRGPFQPKLSFGSPTLPSSSLLPSGFCTLRARSTHLSSKRAVSIYLNENRDSYITT